MAEVETKPKEAPKAEEPKKAEAKAEPAKAEAGKEAPAEGAKEGAAPPAKSGGKGAMLPYIMLGAVLLVLPIVGFLVARLALAPRIAAVQKEAGGKDHEDSKDKKENAGKAEAKKEEPKEAKKEASKEEKGKGEKGEKGEGGARFSLTDQVVNIAGTRGTRFLRAGMEFEAPPSVLTEMEQRKAQVTDIVATALASKRMEELEAPDVRQKLRTEIVGLLNSVLKSGEITNLYFTELIIQ